jgi:hypothetical protein
MNNNLNVVNIGIDLDGVLANFSLQYSKMAAVLYGYDIMPIIKSNQEIKNWNWSEWYPITREQETVLWYEIKNTENFWTRLPVIDNENTKNLVNLINSYTVSSKSRLNVYFITSRIETAGMSAKNQSEAWLSNIGIKSPIVLVSENKGDLAKILKLDFLIGWIYSIDDCIILWS